MTNTNEASRLAEECKRLAKELNAYGAGFPDGKGIFGEAAVVLDRLASLSTPQEGGQAGAEVARDSALLDWLGAKQGRTNIVQFLHWTGEQWEPRWAVDSAAAAPTLRAAIDAALAAKETP